MRSGGKGQKGEPLTIYTSPVIPEALEYLYHSVCCSLLCFYLQKNINHTVVLMSDCGLTLQTFGQSEQKKTSQQNRVSQEALVLENSSILQRSQ